MHAQARGVFVLVISARGLSSSCGLSGAGFGVNYVSRQCTSVVPNPGF